MGLKIYFILKFYMLVLKIYFLVFKKKKILFIFSLCIEFSLATPWSPTVWYVYEKTIFGPLSFPKL